jgi:hypothetical protein
MWVLCLVVILAALPHYFVQFWFNQSLGYQSIFWTNIRMQASLFLLFGLCVMAAMCIPIYMLAMSQTLRKASIHAGTWLAIIAGSLFAGQYQQFLLAFNGVPFGVVDPVFGRDIGFYVYVLPALRMALTALEAAVLLGVVSAITARYDALRESGVLRDPALSVRARICTFATPLLNVLLYGLGGLQAVRTYLSRYELLVRDNESSGVRSGAEYLDVVGVFSTLNQTYLNTVIVVALTVIGGVLVRRAHLGYGSLVRSVDAGRRQVDETPWSPLGIPARIGLALVAVQISFAVCVLARDFIFVTPNEPVIQKEFITRHIEATTKAYGLDRVEVHEWVPPSRPLSPEALLASRTVQNAPVLPSWVSYLEEPPDIQHYERIKTSESTMVFGPLLQVYQQEQQLRPYYDFLSVDGVRYTVDGQKRMFASAVRELPSLALVGQKEWLKYWGSAALQFTHGMGLVMSATNKVDEMGAPTYAVKNVPPQAEDEALGHEPRIYFGEGAKDDYVLTGVKNLKEFDYASEQAREEFTLPSQVRDGIPMDSLFKRVVFAAYTKDVTAFLFSRYIDPTRTRVHIRRTPMSRVSSLAPFLFLDSNTYAFIADKRVLWMVNGLTTTDQYPYSYREVLGDKADERAVEAFPERVINYAEDSVKVTMDAYSGEVRIYRTSEDPIVRTWERIYPDLFVPASAMPQPVAAQLTYPLQWLHIQFDDIYKRYHQRDPIQFYNVEDLWDDADETMGSLGRGLSGFGTGDQMTFSYEGYNALLDPVDMPDGVTIGAAGDLQYALLMPFTPESARNLRSLIVALQDPGSYGRLISLQIPQGMFVPGPEQIDAYIDNDRPVHQQVTMWIRHASEVMRGSTLLLPVGGDLMYVETIWVNSLQNELPQLKLVALRYHDRITSGATVEAAIRMRGAMARGDLRLAEAATERGGSNKAEHQQRDRQRRDGQQQPNADKLTERNLDAQAPARLQPEQARQRPHR